MHGENLKLIQANRQSEQPVPDKSSVYASLACDLTTEPMRKAIQFHCNWSVELGEIERNSLSAMYLISQGNKANGEVWKIRPASAAAHLRAVCIAVCATD